MGKYPEFFEDIRENICSYACIPEERRKRAVWINIKDNKYVKIIGDSDLEEGEYFDQDMLFYYKEKNIYLISSLSEKKTKDKPEDKVFKLRRYPDGSEVVAELTLTGEVDGENIDLKNYLPYLSIIEPTPISWQFVMPAEDVPFLISKIREKYNEWFGFVYGKLPLHIGVVVQNYHKPLYVGINALRRIRRDIEEIEGISGYRKARFVKDKINKSIKNAKRLGLGNNPADYYSFYWGKNLALDKESYIFYVKPDDKGRKVIRSIEKIDDDDEICIMPNTFDFEFMDANIRRNDIFYEEWRGEETGDNRVRRRLPMKDNRPYDIDIFWPKFEKFKELFKEENKARNSKLQKLINVIYEYAEEAENMVNFIASSFVNILNLNNDEELRKGIAEIMDIEDAEADGFHNRLAEKINPYYLKMFVDMFEFGHVALKGV